MIEKKGTAKNYKFVDYVFNKTTVRYVVMNYDKSVFMLVFPNDYADKICDRYETIKLCENGFPNHCDWYAGSLVHMHLSHHCTPMYENSYKMSESTKNLKFECQRKTYHNGFVEIETEVIADEGYGAIHRLRNYDGENGFEVDTKFFNNSGKSVILEMLTSVSLDNLNIFGNDNGSKDFIYHTFKGGWSSEGKHVEHTLSQMNMEKAWGGSFECEKIGSVGSKTVGRYHPYAAIEDKENDCIWGIKLKHNATWQIELSRCGTPISLSGGIGDFKFGHWRKNVENGGTYLSPTAYIAASKGGIDEVSNDLNEMNNRDIDAYGECGMPIIFNDWVTHWGDTSYDKLISLAKVLEKSKVKYFVVDDGWQTGGVGDWILDTQKFPNGLKSYSDEIRSMGMVPGIWMEFESVRTGAERWAEKYDDLYLKKDGVIINNAVSNSTPTKFLDFRKKEVIDYLDKVVIQFLKDNHIGYLKVDYNANIGMGCDDADSYGEGLIEHMDAVYDFFNRIKVQIPDIVIENCSMGGSRLEPKMMSVTAMSSFSDAHESIDTPIIAANMHYLISPRQSQIWCVLKEDFAKNHMRYVIASGFLGRLCWSGYIDKLLDWQFDMLQKAETFYEKVSDIIKNGRSYIYRTSFVNNRKPQGTQAVVRYSKDRNRVLVVCHSFENAKKLTIDLIDDYEIEDTLYEGEFFSSDRKLEINIDDFEANVFVMTIKKTSKM